MVKIIIFGFVIRFFIAVWNGFWGPSFGAEMDAINFHTQAVYYSSNLLLNEFKIGWFYSYILGIVYYFVNSSLFFGSFLSCISWLYSALLLHRSMKLIDMKQSNQRLAMLLYISFPSSIFFTSVTLRESYQLLFVNMAIYAALKVYFRRSSLHWLMLLIAVAGMGVLHGTLLVFGVLFLIGTAILIMFRGRKDLPIMQLVMIAPIVALMAFYGLRLLGDVSYNLNDGFSSAIESFQYNALDVAGRANYKYDVSVSGIFDLLIFLPVSLFQYLFEPMPWRSIAVVDLPILIENMIRVWLIWKAVKGLRAMTLHNRRPVLFIFIAFIVVELIWSIGTINWGTAARHHIPSLGLLLIPAFAYSQCIHQRLLRTRSTSSQIISE